MVEPTRSAVEVARRYFEACNEGTADAIAAMFVPDATIYDLNLPPVRGADAIGRSWQFIRDKWNGARWSVVGIAGDEHRATVEWTMTGSSDGGPFTWAGIDAVEVDAGLITEIRQYWNFRGPVDSLPVDHPHIG